VALDAERPPHDAERQLQRLQHRPLLDAQLQVSRGALELPASLRRPVSSTPRSTSTSGSAQPSASFGWRSSSRSSIKPAAALEPNSERPNRAPSSSAQLTSRTVTGGSPRLASRRSTSTPANTLSEPSSQPPFATESMWPLMRTARSEPPRSVHHRLPAASISFEHEACQLLAEPAARGLPGLGPGDPLRAVLVPSQLAELLQVGDCSARRLGTSASLKRRLEEGTDDRTFPLRSRRTPGTARASSHFGVGSRPVSWCNWPSDGAGA
jgi:hypothetical protein